MTLKKILCSIVFLAAALPCLAKKKPVVEAPSVPPPSPAFARVLDQMIEREADNLRALREFTPIVETYLQEMAVDDELGTRPVKDDYMLGRVRYRDLTEHLTMLGSKDVGELKPEKSKQGSKWNLLHFGNSLHFGTKERESGFVPEGFAHTAMIDGRGLDRTNYDFEYVGREFLGELRCIVIDASPKPNSGEGRFLGRLWVEDRGYNIVRFNGTYSPRSSKGLYLHFDTWRLNMQPEVWLPAYIYSEEADLKTEWAKHIRFKAQTRLWAYSIGRERVQNTFTQVLVDSNDKVNDQSETVQDLSPVASQRAWERQAEDNALDRMERGGLLAKAGDVDKILTTVLNNLIVTNDLNIEPEVRARVMLTTPIETYSVGHTIVVSRGLLDVLPDEASLAAVLANELAHIVLGHRIDTRYAFDDRLIFSDESALRHLSFERSAVEQQAADKKAMELLQKSPYKDKLAGVGLFLRQLEQRRGALPELVRARLGNPLSEQNDQLRLSSLMSGAAELNPTKVDQVAALPLGGRIKVDPWANRIEMVKNKPVTILAASEKMPLEITPIFPYLSRFGGTGERIAPEKAPTEQPRVGGGGQ